MDTEKQKRAALDVSSLAAHQFNKMLTGIMADANDFEAELTALLTKYNFKPSYIKDVVPDLVEAYMNEDEKPIWLKEDFDADSAPG